MHGIPIMATFCARIVSFTLVVLLLRDSASLSVTALTIDDSSQSFLSRDARLTEMALQLPSGFNPHALTRLETSDTFRQLHLKQPISVRALEALIDYFDHLYRSRSLRLVVGENRKDRERQREKVGSKKRLRENVMADLEAQKRALINMGQQGNDGIKDLPVLTALADAGASELRPYAMAAIQSLIRSYFNTTRRSKTPEDRAEGIVALWDDQQKPSQRERLSFAFQLWYWRHGRHAEMYFKKKLLIVDDLSVSNEEFAMPIILIRQFAHAMSARSQDDRGIQMPALDAFLRTLIKGGVQTRSQMISLIWMLSDQVTDLDVETSLSSEQSRSQEAWIRYYFSRYANPSESCPQIINAVYAIENPNLSIKDNAEASVLYALSHSRAQRLDTVPLSERFSPEQVKEFWKQVDTAQTVLDLYVPELFGIPFALSLKENILVTEEFSHADHLAHRVVLWVRDLEIPRILLRFILHETLHLGGLGDKSLTIIGARTFQEAMVEYFTQRVYELAARDGFSERYPNENSEYARYVSLLRSILFTASGGSDAWLRDFYVTGDLKIMAETLIPHFQAVLAAVENVRGVENVEARHHMKVDLKRLQAA